MFRSLMKPSSAGGGFVNCTSPSYWVRIRWFTFVTKSCGLWPYVRAVCVCVCVCVFVCVCVCVWCACVCVCVCVWCVCVMCVCVCVCVWCVCVCLCVCVVCVVCVWCVCVCVCVVGVCVVCVCVWCVCVCGVCVWCVCVWCVWCVCVCVRLFDTNRSDLRHCSLYTDCVNLGCDAVPVGVQFPVFRSILVPSSSGSISPTWNGCAYSLLYIDSIRHAWMWLRHSEIRTNCRVQWMMCADSWEFDVLQI